MKKIICTSQPSATPTPRKRAQSLLLELECYVAVNGQISMTITLGVEKPISPHVVRFSQAIGHELAEQRGESISHVELFRQTHVRDGTFVSQAMEDTHVVSHSLGMRYARQYWIDDQTTQKAHKPTSVSSSMTSCLQSTVELQLQVKLDQVMQQIEE
ncbi:CACTA en-spm transposon protein [Cucumis melo var. makuwa]|uniref:CACTA en-spm transposon protein n=1 Tax=Cucumis melo var. makuwa TaxID=1194695 RepID=A0A5A7VKM3_CUCMM|nr:CACTA en-spm transposon protein [Cucumis melo var. makuwa]